MKKATGFLLMLAVLAGCDNSYKQKITRTASSPRVMTFSQVIPLGHDNCTEEEVYGPDMSCGPLQEVRVCDQFGGNCHQTSQFPSCRHTRTSCQWVHDFDANVRAEMIFDSNAVLSGDQKEEFEIKASYNAGIITLRPKVKSSVYHYAFPAEVKFQYTEVGQVRFDIAPAHQ